MAILLTNATTTLTLPDDLSWADEFSWQPVVQTKTYTTTGALLIEEATRQAGRPITLESATDRAWCTRYLVTTLRTWASSTNASMTLVLRGTTRTVTFDHEKGALQGLPVFFYADSWVEAIDYYMPTIRLLEL